MRVLSIRVNTASHDKTPDSGELGDRRAYLRVGRSQAGAPSFIMTVSFLVYCLAGFSSPSSHAGGPSIRLSQLEEQDGLAWNDYKISAFESSSTAT